MLLRLAAGLVLLAGCDPATTVRFRAGSEFQIATASLDLPSELREDRDGRAYVRSVSCASTGRCPSSADVTIECRADVCDPAPKSLTADAGVIDLDAVDSELRDIVSSIESIHIDAAEYQIQMNTLTVDIGEVEIFWGPEGASDITTPGVVKLGTVPPIASGSTGMGQIALDGAGNDALSSYLTDTSRRIRTFVRTQADLEPGGPYPDGTLRVSVVMDVTAVGRVVE